MERIPVGRQALDGRSVAEWLHRLGVRDEDIQRALRLARRATILSIGPHEAVLIVPSQRLHRLTRRHLETLLDLASLLQGETPRTTSIEVGELPPEQQLYRVKVTRRSASCTCPATILGRAPLCIHRLAAAAKLYEMGRTDLLEWLPGAVRDWYQWRRRLSMLLRKRSRPQTRGPALTRWSRES